MWYDLKSQVRYHHSRVYKLTSDCPQQVAESIKTKSNVLALTANAVSHFVNRCTDLNAHNALALRMAYLVHLQYFILSPRLII